MKAYIENGAIWLEPETFTEKEVLMMMKGANFYGYYYRGLSKQNGPVYVMTPEFRYCSDGQLSQPGNRTQQND